MRCLYELAVMLTRCAEVRRVHTDPVILESEFGTKETCALDQGRADDLGHTHDTHTRTHVLRHTHTHTVS